MNSYRFGVSNRRENKFCLHESLFRLHFKTTQYFDGHALLTWYFITQNEVSYEILTSIEFQTHMCIKRNIQRVCAYSFCFGYIIFIWKSHADLKFYFDQNDWCEIHTVLSFISPQFMWTQVKSWLNTEVRFSTEMKYHTGLSSFRISCKHTLISQLCLHFFEKL